MDPMMMALMGGDQIGARNTGEVQGPERPVDFDDPDEDPFALLAQEFNLSPEEVEQLRVPTVPGGPSLADRLRSLRPNMSVGNMELGVEGNRVTGRMEF